MGLAANLSNRGALRTKIHINEVRRNELNRQHISDEKVKAIAWSIQSRGQLENATVYEDDCNDQKKYTLIGGETRWRAIKYLYEKGASDGYMYVTVIPKPKNIYEEKSLIHDDNIQRDKTDEDLYIAICDAEEYYDYLCTINQRPTGKKRDYVGSRIGMSGRNVDNIKKKFEGLDENDKPIPVNLDDRDDTKETKTKKEDDHLKSQLKDLKVSLEKIYQCKIKVSEKGISFTCKDMDELNELFEKLGIQEAIDLVNV